jgi:hypothetical protein
MRRRRLLRGVKRSVMPATRAHRREQVLAVAAPTTSGEPWRAPTTVLRLILVRDRDRVCAVQRLHGLAHRFEQIAASWHQMRETVSVCGERALARSASRSVSKFSMLPLRPARRGRRSDAHSA